MSQLWLIVLTSCLTVLGGLFVIALGRIIEKLIIDPVHELRKLIGEIAFSLSFYGNVYCNPGSGEPETMDNTSRVLREHASHLRAGAYAIRWYRYWEYRRWLPKQQEIALASKRLILLSNCVHKGDPIKNDDTRKEIENLLGIKPSRGEEACSDP